MFPSARFQYWPSQLMNPCLLLVWPAMSIFLLLALCSIRTRSLHIQSHLMIPVASSIRVGLKKLQKLILFFQPMGSYTTELVKVPLFMLWKVLILIVHRRVTRSGG